MNKLAASVTVLNHGDSTLMDSDGSPIMGTIIFDVEQDLIGSHQVSSMPILVER